MMLLTTAPLGLLLLVGLCLTDQHFGYDEHDGPATWGEHFPTCSGKRQSPINIDERNVKSKKFQPLELCGKQLHNMTIVNNGHTIMLKSEESSDDLPVVTGGPLGENTYKFEQLHFHWGKNNSEGSETTINNKSFPFELHAVFYKEEYGSMSEALNHSDGLVVLGYMYEVGRFENKIFRPIVKVLPDMTEGKETEIIKFQLSDLLKPDDSHYFTYEGSLTTPPCSEVVTWFIFKNPKSLFHKKSLSNSQLNAFRKVKTQDGVLTHNFRPVQPLGDREVYRNIPNVLHSGQYCKKLPLPWVMLQTLGLFLFAV